MSLKDLEQRGEEDGAYILVDWDRTLRCYDSWEENKASFGAPIPTMVERVQRWLHTGVEVRIFTARVSHEKEEDNERERSRIQQECLAMFGRKLKVQNWKCFKCIGIWDDLAITVERNTGWRTTCQIEENVDPLSKKEEIDIFNKHIANTRIKP